MIFPTFTKERQGLQRGFDFIAGCDEVGAGPVAGPVVVAACILNPNNIGEKRSGKKWYYRVRDSKTVSEKEREKLVEEILKNCISYGIGEVQADEIDKINIHQAKLLAMKLAVEDMLTKIDSEKGNKVFLLVDGKFVIKNIDSKKFLVEQEAVIAGDSLILSIAAASIIAKVYRDKILKEYDLKHPEYGFIRHKGYNTKEHVNAIITHGITEFHRKSFLKRLAQ
ncbi:MAG: ribonuclease [Candidatus Doudnabacteria bacterium]|nr:ribonuclease [Candidatus Doudnabacteria bacterium]